MPAIRKIAVVSDLHCGSTVGLLPPDFTTLEENEVKQNKIQQWLWKCWHHLCAEWLPEAIDGDPFALVINGDCTQGIFRKDVQLISPNEYDQVAAAEGVLSHLCKHVKPRKTFMVEGTECHTGSTEHGIARRMGAVKDPNTGKPAWAKLDITIAGTRCTFKHHITATKRTWLEASGLGLELNNEQVEAAKNDEPLPRVLGCAHRHRFGMFQDAAGLCVVSAPWQMLGRYGHKVVGAARTRPGAYVLDWTNREDGEIPEVHYIAYRPAQLEGVTL